MRHSVRMSIEETRSGTPSWRLPALVASVIVTALALTWTYLGMRAVMDVGGSCADGGPYVSAQPCPDGAGLLTLGIPITLVAVFAGSFVAVMLKAPTLLLPMWAGLFGSLGWNFFDYGLSTDGGQVVSWIVCGVVFWLMAAPALFLMTRFDYNKDSFDGVAKVQSRGRGLWWAIYAALAVVGVALGAWSFDSWT